GRELVAEHGVGRPLRAVEQLARLVLMQVGATDTAEFDLQQHLTGTRQRRRAVADLDHAWSAVDGRSHRLSSFAPAASGARNSPQRAIRADRVARPDPQRWPLRIAMPAPQHGGTSGPRSA